MILPESVHKQIKEASEEKDKEYQTTLYENDIPEWALPFIKLTVLDSLFSQLGKTIPEAKDLIIKWNAEDDHSVSGIGQRGIDTNNSFLIGEALYTMYLHEERKLHEGSQNFSKVIQKN